MVAGESGAQVDAVFELEEAARPIDVNVITDRGATQLDSVFENPNESQPQAFEFGLGQLASQATRTYAGAKEALVGVDVTDAGEQLLVEQGGLDG